MTQLLKQALLNLHRTEAEAAGDLSIMLRYHDPLSALFKSKGWSMDNFSDLIGALSKERVAGWSWGHSGHGTSYYASRVKSVSGLISHTGQAAEAFANLTDALLYRHDPLYEELLQALAPNFTKWYDKLIAEVLKSAN